MSREYTKFQQHVDNALETVQGGSINTIQNAINNTQGAVTDAYNKSFLDDSIFILGNNPYVNMMFYIDFSTQDDIFRVKSSGYVWDANGKCVYADTGNTTVIHTIAYRSTYGSFITNFIVSPDADIPLGSIIKYYVSTDMVNYYPIKAGDSTPLTIPGAGGQVYLKAEIIKNSSGESPKLYAVALYYCDTVLEANNSLKDPSIKVIPNDQGVGYTMLVYDSATGRIKNILEQNGDSTSLTFDDTPEGKGRLQFVTDTTGSVTTEYQLVFGTYLNSEGKNVEALMGINSTLVPGTSGGDDQ